MDAPTATPGNEARQQPSVIAAVAVMLFLSTVTISLRFYTRRVVLGFLGIDDWMILAAFVCGASAAKRPARTESIFAFGRPVLLMTEDEMSSNRLEEWYTFLLYAASLSCSKISILLLYRRFLILGWARICNNVVLAIVVACSIWVMITSLINCIPLRAVWDKTIEGKCLSLHVKYGSSYAHVITDFMIFVLPIPFVISLKLGRRQKIGLMLVFCVGFVACLISVIRIVVLSLMDLSDMTHQLASLAVWGAVEVNLAIICACLTTLKPLIVRILPRLLKSSYAADSGQLAYIDQGTGTAARVSRNHGTIVKAESASFVKLDNARSNDSEEYEIDDLEGQIQRGVYMAAPAKVYARLP
ncbi:hypothetical protein C8A00DRAFT_12471 [Chaetomidium leptoderma]|uniref:Rhodopsin domain-containing protein n=1 Tax=Chaetomidium leptoderma TaxID=669021 RepID=A0AAN7A074_9PEZI|nr:hypothetical protein C8A00DRAFT_12471 [Chaetomidium leptoderma]